MTALTASLSCLMHLLNNEQMISALQHLPDWHLHNGELTKTFTFPDFNAAFAFMTRVAMIAEKLDHHPDWSNSFNIVKIALISHAKGGLTARDTELAMAIEKLFE